MVLCTCTLSNVPDVLSIESYYLQMRDFWECWQSVWHDNTQSCHQTLYSSVGTAGSGRSLAERITTSLSMKTSYHSPWERYGNEDGDKDYMMFWESVVPDWVWLSLFPYLTQGEWYEVQIVVILSARLRPLPAVPTLEYSVWWQDWVLSCHTDCQHSQKSLIWR